MGFEDILVFIVFALFVIPALYFGWRMSRNGTRERDERYPCCWCGTMLPPGRNLLPQLQTQNPRFLRCVQQQICKVYLLKQRNALSDRFFPRFLFRVCRRTRHHDAVGHHVTQFQSDFKKVGCMNLCIQLFAFIRQAVASELCLFVSLFLHVEDHPGHDYHCRCHKEKDRWSVHAAAPFCTVHFLNVFLSQA